MDRKTYVGVALCVLFLVFYRPILHWAHLDQFLPQPATTSAPRDTTRAAATAPPSAAPSATTPAPGATPAGTLSSAARSGDSTSASRSASLFAAPRDTTAPGAGGTWQLETPLYTATFSAHGARLTGVELKKYASANGARSRNGRAYRTHADEDIPAGDRVSLAGAPLFGVDLGSGDARRDLAAVRYDVQELVEGGRRTGLQFTAQDSSGAFVRQTYRVRPGNYAMDLDVELRGIPLGWRVNDYSLSVGSWPMLTEADELADAKSLRATSLVGTNLHREAAGHLVGKPKVFEGNAAYAAIQSRYFVSVVAIAQGSGRQVVSTAVRRPMLPAEQAALPPGTHVQMEVARNALVVALPSELTPVQHYVLYTGPCEYFGLSPLKLGLDRLVELGWSWIRPFSHALLVLLKWLYSVVRNYGVAIILLATLIRLVLHPLNVTGLKSMRAMQRIQPEIERIRQKYKDDAQTMNTAMMALYRENKVNPAGGCLPTLIQLPVFFALYSVLFNAIELRQAPFVGWIHDLSAPDLLFTVAGFPVRLLPILMGLSGLASQKFTPTDPRQLPTMYLMNVFMTVFFYNLPSGLVLYWTLMNVLTAVQQWLVLREHGGSSAVVVATAPVADKARRPAVADKARRR